MTFCQSASLLFLLFQETQKKNARIQKQFNVHSNKRRISPKSAPTLTRTGMHFGQIKCAHIQVTDEKSPKKTRTYRKIASKFARHLNMLLGVRWALYAHFKDEKNTLCYVFSTRHCTLSLLFNNSICWLNNRLQPSPPLLISFRRCTRHTTYQKTEKEKNRIAKQMVESRRLNVV